MDGNPLGSTVPISPINCPSGSSVPQVVSDFCKTKTSPSHKCPSDPSEYPSEDHPDDPRIFVKIYNESKVAKHLLKIEPNGSIRYQALLKSNEVHVLSTKTGHSHMIRDHLGRCVDFFTRGRLLDRALYLISPFEGRICWGGGLNPKMFNHGHISPLGYQCTDGVWIPLENPYRPQREPTSP